MKTAKLKKVECLELNEAYYKVMCWFFSYPLKAVSLSDLAKITKLSKTTINRLVTLLAKEKFLTITPFGNIWRITCNQEHHYNIERKIAYNLQLVYQSEVLREIQKHFPNSRSITLFGSYRKGSDIDSSDLDIAVEVLDDEETKIIELGVIPQLGYRKNVKVNILKFTRNRVDLNLFANIANGIILFGFLEVRP